MLEIRNLTKKYKNSDFYSVKNLNLVINEGEIFGFLGKNGAGKSTTIKCMTGLLPFGEGKILVRGHDIAKDPINAKLNIGYVPDNHAVYENLTGKEYVNYMGNIYRVDKDILKERLDEFARLFNMSHAIDKQIRSYSHGMKQKICIIAALIHNPKFWVLDEPLMGLDPQSIAEIKGYMIEHKKKGNTVFFSSHNIDMVEKLCDRVGIMNHGQLMEIIDIKEFTSKSDESLEDYFLNLTREDRAKVIKYDEKQLKKERKAKKKQEKLERKLSKNNEKSESKSLDASKDDSDKPNLENDNIEIKTDMDSEIKTEINTEVDPTASGIANDDL